MNDIYFDMAQLKFSWDYFVQAQDKVRESTYGFSSLVQKMESESASFQTAAHQTVAHIRENIRKVQSRIHGLTQKREAAKRQKRDPIPEPSQGADPEKIRRIQEINAEIREQNEKIDAFLLASGEAIRKLEEIVNRLSLLENAANKEREKGIAAVSNFQGHGRDVLTQGAKVRETLELYAKAFFKTVEDAEALYQMAPRQTSDDPYLYKVFSIKNTHTHLSGGMPFFSGGSVTPGKTRERAEESDIPVIRERNGETFLELAVQTDRFRLPSANLHKLGGKALLFRLEQLGYGTVLQNDGSIIDSNGMIHWEKKHD